VSSRITSCLSSPQTSAAGTNTHLAKPNKRSHLPLGKALYGHFEISVKFLMKGLIWVLFKKEIAFDSSPF